MKVGFLGFGEVASTISKWLIAGGAEVYTSVERRSMKTQHIAGKIKVNICKNNKTVAEISDILISAVTPKEAVNIAREVGRFSEGIYVDLNNISPQTAKKALNYIENGKTVDAAIMGGINKEGIQVQIIASGSQAQGFSKLNEYGLNIKALYSPLGHSKALKMLRSSYTKGVSALLFESLYSAYEMGLDEELLESLEKTECPQFRENAISRLISSSKTAERRAQEMDEVIGVISEYYEHPYMSKATLKSFKMMYKALNPDKSAEDYVDVFESMK
jgi:3-hydroxyisobutyrate dehydrogenase-like beta-hydroxyacid dehydrogenase